MAGLDHMACIARRLLIERGLTVEEVKNPKATLRRIKELPSIRKVKFLKNGEEQWGPSYAQEYNEYRHTHAADLDEDYPRDRAWWPTALHVLITDGGMKLTPDRPWLAWYEAILGDPYPDFLPEMDWKALIHQHWLDKTREWRFGWESKFIRDYPDANKYDVLVTGVGGGNVWGEWRMLSYIKGFATVEGCWEEQAFERLAREQDVAEIFQGVDKQPA